MAPTLYTTALTIAAVGGLARGVAVICAFLRTFLVRKRFVAFRFGRVEILVSFEPLVLLGVGYFLFTGIDSLSPQTAARTLLAVAGAALVLIGWVVVIWTFLSWPSIFAGHGLLEDHRLITRGAYGVVRHPVYLGAFLVWLGLALAFSNVFAFAFTMLYVIPVYVLYLRTEERMMLERFGQEYRDYRERVPMLIPRLRRGRSVNVLTQTGEETDDRTKRRKCG